MTAVLGTMAGQDELALSAARVDPNRVSELGKKLGPRGARELAFACATLVMAQDILAPAEHQFATTLGAALTLDPDRLAQLAGEMEALARTFRG